MISFPCPSCARTIQTQDANAGKSASCLKCGSKLVVPTPGVPVPPVIPVAFRPPETAAAVTVPMARCPSCGREVSTAAVICPGCGQPNPGRPPRTYSPTVAGLLSFVIPGSGHWYMGKRFAGLVWFTIALTCNIVAFPLGLFPAILAVLDTQRGAKFIPDRRLKG